MGQACDVSASRYEGETLMSTTRMRLRNTSTRRAAPARTVLLDAYRFEDATGNAVVALSLS